MTSHERRCGELAWRSAVIVRKNKLPVPENEPRFAFLQAVTFTDVDTLHFLSKDKRMEFRTLKG